MRGGCTPGVTLYAKTWDVLSICTSVEAYKSVQDLERFNCRQGDKVFCEKDNGERRIHTKSYLVCTDLGCVEHMHKC